VSAEEGWRRCRDSVRVLTERLYYRRPNWVDGTSQFAALIRQRLRPEFRILDLGAGDGRAISLNFQGEVRSVIGVDPNSYIKENSKIDHGVIGLAEHLPFRTESFDLIVSDWVVEHLSQPKEVASEVFRVVKSGGFFVLRTGNICHYSYAVAAATPYWFHRLVANRVRGIPSDSGDPHATYYRMNTQRAVRECLTRAGFAEEELLMVEAEPSYLMFSVPSLLLGVAYERLVNWTRIFSGVRACIFACFRKP
jgi:ubiquinone/menaquinone biosynthesis C-methylase UbiE